MPSDLRLKCVGGALLSALSFLSILTFHPLSFFIISFASLPLYYLSFAYHPYAGAGAALIAFVAMGLGLGLGVSLFYMMFIGGPLCLLALLKNHFVMYEKEKPFIHLEKLVTVGTLYFTVIAIVLAITGAAVLGLNPAAYQQIPELQQSLTSVQVGIIPYIPGIITAWANVMAFINVAIAIALVKQRHPASLPFPPFQTFRLPFFYWAALAVLGLLAVVLPSSMGMVFKSAALVWLMAFALEGFSVLSVLWCGQKNETLVWLVVTGIIFIFNFLLIGVIILGLFEPWLKLRQKIEDRRRD